MEVQTRCPRGCAHRAPRRATPHRRARPGAALGMRVGTAAAVPGLRDAGWGPGRGRGRGPGWARLLACSLPRHLRRPRGAEEGAEGAVAAPLPRDALPRCSGTLVVCPAGDRPTCASAEGAGLGGVGSVICDCSDICTPWAALLGP